MTTDASCTGPTFSDDLLEGAEAISAFLYGDAGKRRKVYHLSSTSRLPTFKLGSLTCARKSKILEWVEAQERRAMKDGDQ